MYELKIKLSNEKSFRIRLNKKYVYIPKIIILTLLGMLLVIVGGAVLTEYLDKFYEENSKGTFEHIKNTLLIISALLTVFISFGLFLWLGVNAYFKIDDYLDDYLDY